MSFALLALALADGPARWEADIAAFEVADSKRPEPRGEVVFYGSSSIRFWKLADSFPDLVTVNRGFGGSRMDDAAHFAARLVTPLKPRAVVVFSGDNDLASGHTPVQVRDSFRELVANLRAGTPDVPVVLITVKPSIARWKNIANVREANRLLRAEVAATPACKVADIETDMLGPDGTPDPTLFVADGLHLSAAGYAKWAARVRAALK